MMEFIVANWLILVVVGAVAYVLGVASHKFATQPTKKQLVIIKHWLLQAVIKAEEEIGKGKGTQKLHFVYTAFASKFKWLSFVVSYDQFASLVDEALYKTREALEKAASEEK